VRQWQEAAIADAVAELLVEFGCTELTMEQVAKRVGIAKGSLYLHTTSRSGLVASSLDRWTAEVPQPSGEEEDPLHAASEALFHGVARGAGPSRPALPCCLRTSPCPHGWGARWKEIALAYGLGDSSSARLIGEAVQALACTPTVRALVDQARLEEAGAIVIRFLDSFGQGSAQSTPEL
jgi:AcrR family transcriptional regulator